MNHSNQISTCVHLKNIQNNIQWSTDGCYLLSSNLTHSICSCNRLSTFAILTDFRKIFEKVCLIYFIEKFMFEFFFIVVNNKRTWKSIINYIKNWKCSINYLLNINDYCVNNKVIIKLVLDYDYLEGWSSLRGICIVVKGNSQ